MIIKKNTPHLSLTELKNLRYSTDESHKTIFISIDVPWNKPLLEQTSQLLHCPTKGYQG